MEPMEPMAPMSPMPPAASRARIRVFGGDGDTELNIDALRESLLDIGPRVRAELDRELPRIREEMGRELPEVMDQLRQEMNRLQIEMPLMRARIGRRVII